MKKLEKYESSKSGDSVAEAMSDAIVYCESVKFQGFEASASQSCTQMSSFVEGKGHRLAKKAGKQWVKVGLEQY